MLTDPKITVAIPVYNGARYLDAAIESVLAQTYERAEVIVVNDGSTDEGATESIARRYLDRIRYIAQENRGVGGALNTVLRHMTGDFFTWLSHDDLWLPHKLHSQVAFYNRLHKKNAILFSDFSLIDENGIVFHESKLPTTQYFQTPMLPLLRGHINGCTLFIPTGVLQEFGPFNENLRFVQDYDLWNKILKKYEFFHQPEHLVKYRIHRGQDTNKEGATIEADILWIRIIDDRSETERVQLSGSTRKFFIEMADFLDTTPYERAAAYARRKIETVIENSLVSIVIPFFNHVPLVVRSARSALAQTHSKLEVILVDDGSTEDITPLTALVGAESRVRLIRQMKTGSSGARNKGIEAARGEYIAFLDQGDVFLARKIEIQLTAMQERGSVMSHSSFERSGPTGTRERINSGAFAGKLYPRIISECPIATSTVMIHRSLVSSGFSFARDIDGSADVLAWAWIALRHQVHGILDALTVVAADEAPADEAKQGEKLRLLLAAFGEDPIHRRQTGALRKLETATGGGDKQAKLLKRREDARDDEGSWTTERLAEELAARLETLPDNPVHDIFYRRGFHLLRKHFYLPIPDDGDALDTFWDRPSELAGVDTNEPAAHHLIDEILPPYLAEFRNRFPIERPLADQGFWLINGSYMAVDAHILYGLIRHYKPRRIIEIGNGNSTLLAVAAAESNRGEGYPVNVLSIDPHPQDHFRSGYPGLDELAIKRVQDIPLSVFETLGKSDILFIDSSHVLRSGNDVQYEFLEILPRLGPGVMVHVHDISLPKPYPKVYFDNQLYWNEQYVLQAFLAFNARYEVFWPGNFMMLKFPEKMRHIFPEIDAMRAAYPSSEPTSFWMRTKTDS